LKQLDESVFRIVSLQDDKPMYTATAFLVQGKRILATADHVVAGYVEKKFNRLVIVHADRGQVRLVPVKVIALRAEQGLALVEAESDLPGTPVTLAAYEPEKAAAVYSISFPGGVDASEIGPSYFVSSVTSGAVSRVAQMRFLKVSPAEPLIQHTATVAPGSSGAPLIDTCGNVLGINYGVQAGFFFAVHSKAVLRELKSLQLDAGVADWFCQRDASSGPQRVPVAAQGRRVALVIGNSSYAKIGTLRNPASDAKVISVALRKVGFSEVIEKHDLTLQELAAELKAFGDLAEGADWAVIYYAGHGVEVEGHNYLLPVDAQISRLSHVGDEALPLERVLAKVAPAKRLRMVILDACRNNPFSALLKDDESRSLGGGLSPIEPRGGVLVAYAARHGTVARDGAGDNSPFAEALARNIGEPGLEISLLFRKVRDEVVTTTRGEQEPFTYGSLPAQAFFFKAN
jgi:hypothetical protein